MGTSLWYRKSTSFPMLYVGKIVDFLALFSVLIQSLRFTLAKHDEGTEQVGPLK
jgi:hypothetical protein